ncbi:hypothetical protein COS59_00960 [Candidatus Wolfebacteria bacterium CG03_land_8_20_14_0_80_36_15]|uniref:Four helix bundle protein n=1 Tax=Candidatus Wolfebacteria bacterium CG03_land_8_20_14_0_80_36_15 TaxID=1975067 RepID=A0A2M7B819_9BACT|nr:MAG: hypothetical protein COS59_00960 [Candidatus Wolfebacteria bacterium CG03_land_8_20_14_0_80_36_15]
MTQERFNTFLKSQQLLMIGSEIMRAKVWQNKNQDKFLSALERGLELIDFSLAASKWKNNLFVLLYLRDKISEFYVGLAKYNIEILYQSL